MTAVCPICNRNDVIENVAGLVERSKNWYGISVTSMGMLLEHPGKPSKIGCGTWLVAILVVSIVFYPFNLAGVFGNFDHPYLQNPLARFMILGLAGVVAGIIAAGLFVAVFSLIRTASYRRELVQWEAKMSRWNRLYYCNRDHIVFDPETGHKASPEDVENFLAGATKPPEGATEQEIVMARAQSYKKPAFVALALELIPCLYPAGLVVNTIYLVKGSRMEKIAGRKLPGVTLLKVLFWFNVVALAGILTAQLAGILVIWLPNLPR